MKLKFNGNEILLERNKGVVGAFVYNNLFNRSLTDDLVKTVGDGTIEKVKIDSIIFLRLVFLMGGLNKNTTFENFINSIPEDYNFMDDFGEVLERAVNIYLPSQNE